MNFVNQRADLSYSTEVIEQIGDPPIVSADTITRQVNFNDPKMTSNDESIHCSWKDSFYFEKIFLTQ